MTSEEFGTFYEKHVGRITTFLAVRFRDEELAQDAVQQAALYVMERLAKYQVLTPSYFRQLAYNRAINMKELGRGHRPERGPKPEVSVGTWFDLARIEDPTTIYDGRDPDAGCCVSEGDDE